ncbi:MAG: acyl--CoA ligase [Spirochaetaceae bacterium]|nr:MAG: acyl--CoA ligase [Spirochaetaceae bacterium]
MSVDLTLNGRIDTSLLEWKNNPCFIECSPHGKGVPVTALELRLRIQERTEQFARWGIQKGFLVPIFLYNSVEFITSLLALMKLQAIPVMVKLEFRKLALAEIFKNCKPQAVITETNHLPFIRSYLKDVVVIERSSAGLRLVQSQISSRESHEVSEDIATVNYTYRGYGYPIGAEVPHRQYLHGAKTLQKGLQANPGEKMLITLPMSHIFTLVGCIAVPILYNVTGVIAQTFHPRIIFQIIRDYSIEYLTSVPHYYLLLLRLKEKAQKLRSLRAFVCGGSLLTVEDYHKISQGFEVEVLHGYGLTECTPVSRNIRGEPKGGTIGPICDQIECRIDDSTGIGSGEILLNTPYMTKTYLDRERETREAFDGDWFKTGDRGYFDGNHLVFSEELKETRKINGNMVDLNEIRKAILLDGQIVEVDIHYKNNALFARCRASRKAITPGKTKELATSLKELLAPYKIPKISLDPG